MLAMDQGVVEEWLSEFKTLPDSAITTYAASLKEKGSLIPALYKVIRENYSDLLEPVCHQLFEFYRSGVPQLQRFTLQFLPELLWSLLSASAARDPHTSGCVEALLLGIYNLEIVDKDGQSKILSFTVPSLSKPSVYHEPSAIGSIALTEGALANHGLSRVAYSGPHLQRETFTAQNRFEVLTFLLLCYNSALSYMTPNSLQSLCQLSSRVSICGYPRQQMRRYKGISTRLTVTSEFLVQLITGIHYALSNGEFELGSKALDDVLYRAQLELFPEALLVGNAIKSSLHSAALKSKEGARSIQVEITPTASKISRNAVTSLSIRGHRWKRNDAVDLGSPDDLMDIAELDERVWPIAMVPDMNPPAITISSSTTTLNLGAKALKKVRLNKRNSEGKECNALTTGRAASENTDLSNRRLTLTSSQSVPKAGALTSLTRTASAVFSRSFEVVTSSNPAPNHSGSEVACYPCGLQEDRMGYLSPKPNHTPCSPSISVHFSPDL
ncbi:hyccin isoform X1 [Poeciliopsis prolifica]|uniref:hyccin isoform X1 n=1 Tax=Poeciliopsis prolifica TaxID=188132 RepID=UPI00241445F0|nr:hyccin isoform X1 [Poeciliopsis prolifica]XP_054914803.1 hyccin isoform X1 [Poeciliopsis prolifica]